MNPPLFDLAYCPIVPALEVIGGKWKPLVVYHIYSGVQRFSGLQRSIPVISKTMLTQQLRELEHDGLLHRQVFAEVPPRVEYTLTALGLTLLPVLFGAFGTLYLASAIVLNALLAGGIAKMLLAARAGRPWSGPAWWVYKYSLLYLALLFLAMAVDRAIAR